MKKNSRMLVAPLFASLVLLASSGSAQSISIGLRGTGSLPIGAFAKAQPADTGTLIAGAKNGFGYGLDVVLGFGPIGIYGGFDQVKFDCETDTCQSDGKYTMQGVTAGVKLGLPKISLFRPFVKGGVTFNNLQGGYGGSESNVLSTDKTPGYEIGVGLDYALLGFLSLTPQMRYVGQNFKAKIPGVVTPVAPTQQAVNYVTFDLGFSLHTPFGGKR